MDATEPRNRNRMATIASLSLVLAFVPACTASAGHGLVPPPAGAGVCVPPAPYVSYRPIYPAPGRTLVLSSYAGSNYPSRLPGAVLTPTDFRILTGKPVRQRAGWFGHGW
jgi:hypothetical protein